MKSIVPALAAFAVAPFVFADDAAETVPANKTAPVEKKTEITPEQRQLFLQGLGWLIGQQSGLIQDLRIPTSDVPAITEGFKLALLGEGKDIPVKIMSDNDAYSAFINELQASAEKAMQAEMKAAADANKKLGAEFIAKTQAEDTAFVVLPSGVLMKIITPGDSAKKPTTTDTVAVRYTGKLIDGTIFDSSTRGENGEPVQIVWGEGETVNLPLGNLIKAWMEAIPQLGVGGQCTLIVPAEQAYGDNAAGMIPPGSTLIFDVELADIPAADSENGDE